MTVGENGIFTDGTKEYLAQIVMHDTESDKYYASIPAAGKVAEATSENFKAL